MFQKPNLIFAATLTLVLGVFFFMPGKAHASRVCDGQWPGSAMDLKIINDSTGQQLYSFSPTDNGTGHTYLNTTVTIPYGTPLRFEANATAPEQAANSWGNYPYGQSFSYYEGGYTSWHTWRSSKPIDSATQFYWSIDPTCRAGEETASFDPGSAEMTINIVLPSFPLTVAKNGSGTGTVTSNPGGINYGSDPSETYYYNTKVVLTATPSSNSTFVGWSGEGCSGTGTCTVYMTQARNVTATFNLGSIPAPSASISASPNPVVSGNSTRITWGSTNATSCGANQGGGSGFLTNNATSGWDDTNSLTTATVFEVRCVGDGGVAYASVTVGIAVATADIKADGQDGTVIKNYNSTAGITWSSSNAGSCSVTANGAATGWASGATGSGTTPAITGSITYVLTCSGASDQVTVNVPPPPSNPAGNCPAPGTAGTVSWTAPAGYTGFYLRIYDITTSPQTQIFSKDDYVGTSYAFTGTSGHSYSWWVHTRNPGNGAYSASVGNTITCQQPAAITFNVSYSPNALGTTAITSLTNSTCGRVIVSWSYGAVSNDPLQYFTVWRGTSTGNYGATPIWSSKPTADPVGVRSWTDTGVAANTVYYYIVKAEEDTPSSQSVASAERSVMAADCTANLSANLKILRVDGATYNSNSTVIDDGSVITYELIISNSGPAAAAITSVCAKLSGNLYRSSGLQISPANVGASGLNASAVVTPDWSAGNCDGANSIKLLVSGTKLPTPSQDLNNWSVTYDTIFKKSTTAGSYESCTSSALVLYNDADGTSKSVRAAVPQALCKTGKNLSPEYREVSP